LEQKLAIKKNELLQEETTLLEKKRVFIRILLFQYEINLSFTGNTHFIFSIFIKNSIPALYIYIFVWISDSALRAISWCAPGVLCRLSSARLHVKLCLDLTFSGDPL